MYSMTPGHHDNHVLQIMQQAHASLYACRDLSGRGLDGWTRLQQAAADDNEQEQAEKRKMPTEDEQVELAPMRRASCAVPCVVQTNLVQDTEIHCTHSRVKNQLF